MKERMEVRYIETVMYKIPLLTSISLTMRSRT